MQQCSIYFMEEASFTMHLFMLNNMYSGLISSMHHIYTTTTGIMGLLLKFDQGYIEIIQTHAWKPNFY